MDNEAQNEPDQVDDQETSEAEGGNEQRERPTEEVNEAQSSLAPVDDDVILK
jgi:hypothetical protein